MPLIVSISSKVPGTEDIFNAAGTLTMDGNDTSEKVLVKDLGEGNAELIVNDQIKPTILNNTPVAAYKGNISATYEGDKLKRGSELTFSLFSFVHKK